jgi:hypothetical protein
MLFSLMVVSVAFAILAGWRFLSGTSDTLRSIGERLPHRALSLLEKVELSDKPPPSGGGGSMMDVINDAMNKIRECQHQSSDEETVEEEEESEG